MKLLSFLALFLFANSAYAEIPEYMGYTEYKFGCHGVTYTVTIHDYYVGEEYDLSVTERGVTTQILKSAPEWEGQALLRDLKDACYEESETTFPAK